MHVNTINYVIMTIKHSSPPQNVLVFSLDDIVFQRRKDHSTISSNNFEVCSNIDSTYHSVY